MCCCGSELVVPRPLGLVVGATTADDCLIRVQTARGQLAKKSLIGCSVCTSASSLLKSDKVADWSDQSAASFNLRACPLGCVAGNSRPAFLWYCCAGADLGWTTPPLAVRPGACPSEQSFVSCSRGRSKLCCPVVSGQSVSGRSAYSGSSGLRAGACAPERRCSPKKVARTDARKPISDSTGGLLIRSSSAFACGPKRAYDRGAIATSRKVVRKSPLRRRANKKEK